MKKIALALAALAALAPVAASAQVIVPSGPNVVCKQVYVFGAWRTICLPVR